MKYSLIPLFSLLFFSSAFADPCAGRKDAYTHSHRDYVRAQENNAEARDKEHAAYTEYHEAIELLSEATRRPMIASILSENGELNHKIDTAYNAFKRSFQDWEISYNQKERTYDNMMRAKTALENREQSMSQCEEESRQQE